MKKRFRVVILTSNISQELRRMLQGVLRYQCEANPWKIYQQEDRAWTSRMIDWKAWGCNGIIAADHHSIEEARRIAKFGVPTVVLLQPHYMHDKKFPLSKYSCCLWNNHAVGKMAAEYYANRKFRNFAYIGDPNSETYWSRERGDAFREELARRGLSDGLHIYAGCSKKECSDWMAERKRMCEWLRKLPKPVAVFAPNDRRAKQVLDACEEAKIPVPAKVSILGVDDDEWICESTVPTLSSVRCNPYKAGYEIAAHLDAMMNGRSLPAKEFLVNPVSVTTRQSTDAFAVEDKTVRESLRIISACACNQEFNVDTLAKKVGASRRKLEMLFQNVIGKTIHDEITRMRLERLEAALVESNDSITDVMKKCGFVDQANLGRMFKNLYGMTMRSFRSLHSVRK